ncbi:type I pantothenate kinase [Streptococcus merionis]|uniref:Pantothenate kinase n=1 Tax=Streptococcus merionis TaxID=400065 RepID=A0A239SV81_9STRE|nr:type I pantothenate kinase [Streptococcus merionis]SNU88644.1 pantothenate kinase [Streptococcus merionis]
MLNEFINFEIISRDNWQNLHRKTTPPLTSAELESIKALNDRISLQDVIDIYLPLTSLIRIYKKSNDDLSFSKSLFLQEKIRQLPFIIGVSGSVAVGKSTTSRLLQKLIAGAFKNAKVEMVTTDGFLYPNAVLEERNLMHRKGFPESYNMDLLLNFLDTIKSGQDSRIPIYSHETYDILTDQEQLIQAPDFLIVEGINVFQNPQNHGLYISDYFDFSIYVDAEHDDIENWYIERFSKLLQLAETDPNNYYHQFTQLPYSEAIQIARDTWKSINLPNLKQFIQPTRSRADLILHKSANHKIDKIFLKK